MLLWRAKEILEGGSELLKAEAELASVRIRSMLVGSAALVLLLLLASIGLLGMLTGLCVLIAPALGWGYTLLSVGGGVVLIASLVALAIYQSSRSQRATRAAGSIGQGDTPPEANAAQAKERMSRALHDEDPGNDADNPLSGLDQVKDEAIEFAIKNPALVGSIAFLAVSIIGPKRAMRSISRTAASAGLISTLLDSVLECTEDAGGSQPQRAQPGTQTGTQTSDANSDPYREAKENARNGTNTDSTKRPASRF